MALESAPVKRPRLRRNQTAGGNHGAGQPAGRTRLRRDPCAFIEQHLHDPETGKPFVLLKAERAFLALALALDDDGRLKHSELIYSAIKKSGKTTFAAIFVITVLLLYGARYAEGYSVANDLEQAQSRVFEMIKRIITASPLLSAAARVTADKITFTATNATISCLASDYASAAGGHPTIAVFDELWGYSSERGRRLFDELVPVPTRKISCRLTVTHAGFSGESTLLNELYERGLQLPSVGTDLHAGNGLLMFWSHVPLAPWQDERWLSEMRRSLRPNQFLRMIENRFVTAESTFIDMQQWDLCVDPSYTMVAADPNLPVHIGVDASTKHDSTAIVAVTWDASCNKVKLIWHRTFQPSPTDPLDFENTIERTLLELRQRFRIRKVLFDPWQMQAVAQRLQRNGLAVEEFPQTLPNLTAMSQNLFELISARNLAVYPDAAMRTAISHTVAVESARGWRLTKEKSSHKIDVVVALAMAAHSAVSNAGQKTGEEYGRQLGVVADLLGDLCALRGAIAPAVVPGWAGADAERKRFLALPPGSPG
jgi:Phage Terminase